ncbi:MAG: NAD(P)/FAD-dependent oxidoreductase [Burkholderiaceae bacterium]|nr:NAD(P)/FAD-dependent oxidoreductase [Microbacteriaceae bacterium]
MTRHVRIAIIGTGFAGLGMAIQLQRSGERDFVIIERAHEVGGTWRDNTYPGAACDIRTDLYSFSFAQNPEWTRRYGKQAEILEYLKSTAKRFDLYPKILFGHELESADWQETDKRWQLRTSAETLTADVVVSGHGPLIDPAWPAITGLDTFAGPRFHSARWDHAVELAGKRIAVIGTGASAVQFVPELAKVAEHLSVFQRTPAWIVPRGDRPSSARKRRLFRTIPLLQRISRAWIFRLAEARFAAFAFRRIGAGMERLATSFLEGQVADPELRAKLTPDYRIGCKRILISSNFYKAIVKPNVELVTSDIRSIEGNMIVTSDGERHEVDVLIGGTGFNATRPPIARLIHAGGRSLADAWSPHMAALHGTTVAGFPNLYVLVGPNTALGHNSIVYIIEAQVDYVLQALRFQERVGAVSLEARADAQEQYNERIQRDLAGSVWTTGGCSSYYLDDGGRNTTLWPHRAALFRKSVARFDPRHYLIERAVPVRSESRVG